MLMWSWPKWTKLGYRSAFIVGRPHDRFRSIKFWVATPEVDEAIHRRDYGPFAGRIVAKGKLQKSFVGNLHFLQASLSSEIFQALFPTGVKSWKEAPIGDHVEG